MDGNTSETPIISDAYALTYVQEMKGQLAALAQQIRVLESQLAGVDANLSTNLDGLQSVMQGQAQALTNETTVRAKLVQGVADDVAELREQHSADHAYLIGEMERHHDEYDAEAASIRASLSEERSERAQGDAEVLAAVQEQSEQAQWYYEDTKAHLAKHDQALDDVTWDSTDLTFDNDDYTFGWSILSAAQEWETHIGSFLNQAQKLVDTKLRNVESTLIAAHTNATKALENTEVEKLLEILQGQVGIEALDEILWGRIEAIEVKTDEERRARIEQIRRETDALVQRLEAEALNLQQQILDEATARADAMAEETARTAEMVQYEAEQRVAEVLAAAEQQAAALAQEAQARNAAIADEARNRALAIQAEAESRASALSAEAAERAAAIQQEVADRSAALIAEANARKAEIQAERDARVQAINAKAAALTADYTARIQQLNTDLKKSIKDVQDGVTASVAELESADASIISSLNAYKVSNNNAVAAVVSRVDTVVSKQEAAATVIEGMAVEIDQNTADISALSQVVATNEQVVAEQISGLTTALEDAETSLGAQIQDAQSAITTLDSSTATRFEQVNAELETKSKEAMDAAASAKSIAESAVTTNAAQATDITNLKARMTTTEGNVAKKADATTVTALSNEVSGLGESVTANSNQLTELAASIQIANQEIGSVKTGVANAQTTANSAVSANNALASRVDALSAMLTDLEEGAETNVDVYAFSALKVDVENLEGRVESNTSDITSIESTLNNVQQGVSGNTSAISEMQTTQTNQGKTITQLVNDTTVLKNDMTTVKDGLSSKADASAMSELLTRVEDVEGVNTSQGSALTNLQNSLDTTNANVAKKADTTALNTLETKVTQVEGKATTNANNITSLTGRVSTVEGDVAKKADATALNNYYTKSETETKATTIAAGQVSAYDASLVIGGRNLYTGPNPVVLRSQTSAGEIKIAATQEGTIQRFNYLNADILDVADLVKGDPTVSSIEIFVPETNQGSFSIQFGTYRFSNTGYRYAPKIEAADVPKGRWVTLTTVAGTFPATVTATGINVVFNLQGTFVAGDVFRWRNLMMEKATKASGFVESDKVIQQKIAANAQAISNTDTKVEEVEGVVTAHTTRLDKLTADLSTTDTKANTAINNAATAQSTANSGVTKAEAAASSVNTLRTEYEATVLDLEKADQENTAAIAKTNTDLISAQTALSNADKALGNRIDGLTTTVSNNLSTVRGEIQDVADSVTTLEGNTNTRFTSLASELETVEGKAEQGITNAANAQTTANTAVSKADANANSIVSLGARLGNAETALGTKASTSALNAVTADVKTLSDGYASNTSAIQKLQADMDSVEADLSTKATTSALNTTNTNVSKIDGRVTTNTNNLNALTSRMTTAEGNIAKKADTTALQNYYTKSQMEDKATTIAAGEVNKFKAGLFIGGRNLVVNESKIVLSSNNNTTYPISLSVVDGIRRFERTAPYSATLSTYCQTQVSLEKGKTYTGSVEVRPVKTQLKLRNALMPVTVDNVQPFSGTVYGPGTICPPGVWTRLTCTVTATADGKVRVFAIYNSDDGYVYSADTGAIEYRNLQIEEGEYATAFTTNESDIKASIDANAQAINTTDAKVQEVDGVVKSHTTSLNKLTADLTTVDTKADTAITNAATAQNTADTAVSATQANATNINSLASRMSTAEGNISKKADATALNGYYTKSEMEAKAATIAAGEVNKYDASLVIGGVNQLLNSEAERSSTASTNREYLMYENSNHIYNFYEDNLGKDVTISFDLKVAVAGPVQVYCSNGTHHTFSASVSVAAADVNKWVRYSVTVQPKKHSNSANASLTKSAVEFYGIYGTGRIPYVRLVQLEAGNKATAWSPSPRDVKAAIDANAQAISDTDARVTNVDGEVKSQASKLDKITADLATTDTKAGTAITNAATAQTTANTAVSKADANASSISSLASRMSTAEGNINKKADATALNNYYTKTAADQAIAGKLEAFSSALVIGGSNLLRNSNFAKAASSSAWSSNGGGYTKVTDPDFGDVVQTNLPNGLTHAWLKLDNGVDYVYSALIKPTNTHAMSGSVPLHYHAGLNNTNQGKISILEVSHTSIPGGVWSRVWIRFTLTGDANSFRPFIYGGAANTIQVAWTQLERGSKPTDWSPSPQDVQNQLDINATAISNVYTKAETNSAITNATNTVKAQLDQNIAQQNSTINAWVERNKVEAVMMETLAAELVPHMAGNTELFADMEINVGYQGVITALADTDASIMSRIDEMQSRYDNALASIGTSEEIRTTAEEAAAKMATTIRAEFKAADTATANAASTALTNALKNYTTTAALQQNYYTKTDANTAISNATTTLQSSIRTEYTNAINAIDLATVSIPDTRSANQTPQWYWTNYARKKITEFKSATAIGLTSSQVGNTYGTLTTIVPWTDSSGGPIRQIMEGSSEANVYVRVSTGLTTWGPWTQQGATLDVKIQEQAQAVNGVRGIKTVTIDNNGVLSGYGLISDLVGGKVTSAFGVNADQFYVGSPATGKKVFSVVNGTTVINDAIIGNLSASKITTGTMHGDRITAGTLSADKLSATALETIKLQAQNIVVLKDKAKPNGIRLELKDGLVSVFDDNNTLRVRLGFWS